MVEAPIQDSSPETGGYGLSGRSVLVFAEDRLAHFVLGGVGEAAGRVAVARGDVPGVQLGADPVDRHMSERGRRPGGARRARIGGLGAGAPSAVAAGMVGGPVVVVAVTRHQGGRESRLQGLRHEVARI